MRLLPFLLLAILTASAQEQMPPNTGDGLGAGLGSRLVTIESSNVVTRAWRRDVVMVDGDGKISGDGGVVGEKASTDAIDEVASNAYTIAEAANDAMTTAMDYLYSKTNQMAQYCVMTALHIAPETVNSNITGYVVKTETNGSLDHQWVWYDRVLGLKPIRYVTYKYFGGTANVKATWVNWTTNGVDLVIDGKTWSGCHECTVERPAFAVGETCLDLPNEEWGGPNGITWGGMALVWEGTNTYYTGYVTNGITQDVIYFENGFLKPAP